MNGMDMKKIILNGMCLSDKDTAHAYLKEMLSFPEHYGKNLDALYDCLTDLSEVEFVLNVPKEQEGDLKKIIRVFKAAAIENENIKVTILIEE